MSAREPINTSQLVPVAAWFCNRDDAPFSSLPTLANKQFPPLCSRIVLTFANLLQQNHVQVQGTSRMYLKSQEKRAMAYISSRSCHVIDKLFILAKLRAATFTVHACEEREGGSRTSLPRSKDAVQDAVEHCRWSFRNTALRVLASQQQSVLQGTGRVLTCAVSNFVRRRRSRCIVLVHALLRRGPCDAEENQYTSIDNCEHEAERMQMKSLHLHAQLSLPRVQADRPSAHLVAETSNCLPTATRRMMVQGPRP